ncbi:MAG: biliverdin-producing heme oxygenase [Sphingomonas sp.]|nr:biliverdin-producing heme oxygenase [Sphingomonas sp.]
MSGRGLALSGRPFNALEVKVRFALKAATDDVHRELDERLSRLDLADRQDYGRFLRFHGRAVPAVESALSSAGLHDLVDGWHDHRRSGAIQADLAALGEAMPEPVLAPALDTVGELLGTAYVLEGSRLGGRVLKRRLGQGFPSDFLSGSDCGGSWPNVIAALDQRLYSDALIGEAAAAARRCFALFLSVAHEVGL